MKRRKIVLNFFLNKLQDVSFYNYNMIMEINIVTIGTSKGIRIPKTLLKQFNFKNSVTVEILPEGLLLKPNNEPRAGWREQFAAESNDKDEFRDWEEATLTEFDEVEW